MGSWTERGRAALQRVRFEACARVVLAGLASWYIGAFLYVTARRIGYPYELEWMEGGVHEHVARVLARQPLYVAPSLEFTPYVYTPLYYWVCAPFAALLGPGLPALRLVSLLATLALFAELFALVRHETRDRLCAWTSVGTFAACFVVGGSWLDLARVDMLALSLALGAALLLVRSERRDALAGVLFGLAFLAKQSSLLIALPLIATRVVMQRGPRRVYAAASCAALIGLSTLALDRASDGWYRFYVFELPASHPIAKEAWRGFWGSDLFRDLPFATACLLFVLVQAQPWRVLLVRVALCAGLLASAWSGRLHTGGYSNVLLPGLWLLSWALGTALHAFRSASEGEDGDEPEPQPARAGRDDRAPRPQQRALVRFAYVLCVLQLAWLWYPPSQQLPTARARAASDRLVERLRKVEGPVLVPFHGHLARLAGKPPHGHEMAFRDVQLGKNKRAKDALRESVTSALRKHRYQAIVLDDDWWERELSDFYKRSAEWYWVGEERHVPVTGLDVAPKEVYVPRGPRSALGF